MTLMLRTYTLAESSYRTTESEQDGRFAEPAERRWEMC